MALAKFTWQNGTQIEPAKVEVGGVSYNVTDAQYEGETPLSAGNLNLMQDTLLGNVADDLTDDTKIPSVKAVKGKVLWANPNPTSSFSAQNITLSSSDYDVLEWYYRSDISTGLCFTQKSLKGYGTQFLYSSLSSGAKHWIRRIPRTSDTEFSAYDGRQLDGGTGTNSNDNCVPLYVIGYKTNLFS